MRHRWRVRTSLLETEGKKELHFKTELEIKFVMCKRRRGRQNMFYETQVESKNKCARDEGEERPFKTEVERKFLICKRRRGRQSMFL